MSLRRSISAMFALVAAFSFGSALMLIALTSYLQRTTTEVTDALQAIRLIQQLELDLVAHTRTPNAPKRAALEAELQQNLKKAERYIGSDTERTAFRRVTENLEAYFKRLRQAPASLTSETPELEAAFGSLLTLLDINAAEATQIENQAAHWNSLVDRVVLLAASGVVIGVFIGMVWLWRFAFQPVLGILGAMTSFATGNRIARAPERGPDELRSIAIQFNKMADALARQYENRLVFLTGVAHDLRNPLSPLKMAASFVGSDEPLPSEEKLRSMLGVVSRQVDRLDRMIGDLLDASRIEAGQLELRIDQHDARLLAREVFVLFQAASPHHTLELQAPDVRVPLYCDAFRIEQVLNNLVSNAIKYSPAGGRVQIAVESASDSAIFRVSDEGIGIRSEDMPLVFEPFHRIRSSSQEIPGVGLGLSVARRIVEAHKGRLELKSQFGKGTTFSVYLPLNVAATKEVA